MLTSMDYWATSAPAAQAPLPQPPAPQAARRRAPVVAVLLVALAAGASAGTVVTRRAQAGVSAVVAVDRPATAAEGWTPRYVDDRGRPARWDACAPIPYVVQAGWLPATGRRDLAEALRRLSAVSGLRFVDEGDTDELPSTGRAAYQPERYGDRWAPLLIGWVPVGATDLGLGNGTQGVSTAVAVPGREGPSIITAQVALNATDRLPGGFGAGSTEGEVLLHELAHAVGLGHVDDPTQVMYGTTTNSESQYGAGDRAGLVALGAAAGCHPAPEAGPLELSP